MDFAAIARQLRESLALRHPPVAIAWADSLPEGVPHFEGAVPAGCAFWELATTRPFATSARDHSMCSIGVHTHHLADPPASHASELEATLAAMAVLDYVRPEEVAAIPRLPEPVRHVVYAPLDQTPLSPDVVMLFVDAAQSLVVTEAAQQVDGGAAPALGRPACAAVPQASVSGRAALSLGCCGARAYLDTLRDDIALWALPGDKLVDYASRIAALAGANRVLGEFHRLRARDVRRGERPTVAQSLERVNS
jgi:uncharacterized protein (DUF169 family)